MEVIARLIPVAIVVVIALFFFDVLEWPDPEKEQRLSEAAAGYCHKQVVEQLKPARITRPLHPAAPKVTSTGAEYTVQASLEWSDKTTGSAFVTTGYSCTAHYDDKSETWTLSRMEIPAP